jgi:hypothetical protein
MVGSIVAPVAAQNAGAKESAQKQPEPPEVQPREEDPFAEVDPIAEDRIKARNPEARSVRDIVCLVLVPVEEVIGGAILSSNMLSGEW